MLCRQLWGASDILEQAETANLRSALRHATANAHDLLDEAMRRVGGWDDRDGYGEFLRLQFCARAPIETWLSRQPSRDLNPPSQCPLIAQDLASLGISPPTYRMDFALETADQSSRSASQLGAAWVMAGSALGNRAILAEMKRKGRGDWPHLFLGDASMLAFWNRLRPQIEGPAAQADVEAAKRSALAVFAYFLSHTKANPDPVTA